MNAIVQWLAGLSWNHLVLALLHSLWQGAAVAGLLALLLAALPARRARLRYGLALTALLMVVAGVAVTWAYLDYEKPRPAVQAAPVVTATPVPDVNPGGNPGVNPGAQTVPLRTGNSAANLQDAKPQAAYGGMQPWLAWAGWLWLTGCGVMLLRVIVMVAHSRRQIEKTSARLNVPDHIHNMVARLCGEMGVRQAVRVLVSTHARNPGASRNPGAPGVIGALWPTLLLPLAVVNDLPADQLRMILAHELAHIRRWDYLVNLGQLVIEALLYFNPAVWWLSRQVRVEREACCDALAVAVTGDQAGYVQALADAAETMGGPAGAALAFGSRERSPLLSRVYRILGPRKRPPVALPWYSLAGLGMLGFFLLISLRGGAVALVAAAEQILTPEQRMQELVQLERTYGQGNGEVDDAEGQPRSMEIAGTIRTEDGSALSKDVQLSARFQRGIAARFMSLPVNDGKFSGKFPRTTVSLAAQAEGYAPTFFGPRAPSDPGLKDIALVLRRGFDAQLRVVDPQGKLLPNARVSVIWVNEANAGLRAEVRNDPSGTFVLAHVLSEKLRIGVDAPGFQFDEMVVTPETTKPMEIKLAPASPTTGLVVAADSGQPVADARIYLFDRHGFANTTYSPLGVGSPELAQTDGSGHFTLDALRDDCTYSLVVRAPDKLPLIVEDVRAGQTDLKWSVQPGLEVRGRIDGALEKLGRTPVVRYRQTYRRHGSSYGTNGQAPVQARDGHGYFEITDLLPGPVTLYAGRQTKTFDAETATGEVVIDLDAPPAIADEPVKRKVILTFDVPAGAPAPRGRLRINYRLPTGSRNYADLPIKDGQVTFDVPAPTNLDYESGPTLGYWVREKYGIEVPEGAEPFTLTIPAVPAGAIYGQVTGPDGKPTANYNVYAMTIEAPANLRDGSVNINTYPHPDAEGKFVLTPLPLGGQYAIMISSNQAGSEAMVFSPILTVEPAHPMQEVKLRLPEGVRVEGKIVDPQGRPVAGAMMRMNLNMAGYISPITGAAQTSDRQGQFHFEHVNPALKIYSVIVQPAADYQGANVPVKPGGGPMTVTLEPGVKVRGQVLDATTGWPIPRATVRAFPADTGKPIFRMVLETVTDDHGEFSFTNMEPREYNVDVDGTAAAGTVITHNPDGSTTYRSPPGTNSRIKVTGGQAEAVTLRLQIASPNLKAVKPEP